MAILKGNHKYLEKDILSIYAINKIKDEIQRTETQYKNTKNYVKMSIQILTDILLDYAFITEEKEEEDYPYKLTEKGKIATNLQEVNGMVFAELLDNRMFDKLTTIELVRIFSCFANISIPKDQRISLESVHIEPHMKQILS